MNSLDDEFIKPDKESVEYTLAKYAIEDAEERIQIARVILFVLGLLTIGRGILFAYKIGFNINILAIPFAFGILYIGMGFLAKHQPVIALSIALVLYIAIQVIIFLITPNDYIFSGSVWKIVIIGMLGIGFFNAIKAHQTKKKYNI